MFRNGENGRYIKVINGRRTLEFFECQNLAGIIVFYEDADIPTLISYREYINSIVETVWVSDDGELNESEG